MNFNELLDIKSQGFEGFKSIYELWASKKIIPKKKGVYLVIGPNHKNTEFINPGVGGFFKGKDPNVLISELEKEFCTKLSSCVYREFQEHNTH